MPKTRLFIFTGVLSLIAVSCNLFGLGQLEISSPPANIDAAPQTEAQNSVEQSIPTPTPTPDPAVAAQNCLAHTWEMTDLSNYIAAAIPPDLMAEYNLQYQETRGQAYLTFTPEGQVTLTADQLEVEFSAATLIFSVPVTVRIDGKATGTYEIDGTTLTVTDFDTQGISASAQAFGEDLVDPDQIIAAIPLAQPPFNTAEFTCQSTTLELTFPNSPEAIPPLTFQMVE